MLASDAFGHSYNLIGFEVFSSDLLCKDILPKLTLKDLASFSQASTRCYSLRNEFYSQLCGKTHDEAIELLFRSGRFTTQSLNIHCYSSNCRIGVGRGVVFVHQRTKDDDGYCHYIRCISTLSLQTLGVAKFKPNLGQLTVPAMIIPCEQGAYIGMRVGAGNVGSRMVGFFGCQSEGEKKLGIIKALKSDYMMDNVQKPRIVARDLSLEGKFLSAVWGEKLIVTNGANGFNIIDGPSGTLLSNQNFAVMSPNRISSLCTDNNCLFVRFSSGMIKKIDLDTFETVATIDGPDIVQSDLDADKTGKIRVNIHFKVSGSYFYTSKDYQVTQWQFPDNDEDGKAIEIAQFPYFGDDPHKGYTSDLGGLNFHLDNDGQYLYVELKSHVVQVWDTINYRLYTTVDLCTGLQEPHKWEFERSKVQDGIMIAIVSSKKGNRYKYVLTDFRNCFSIPYQMKSPLLLENIRPASEEAMEEGNPEETGKRSLFSKVKSLNPFNRKK